MADFYFDNICILYGMLLDAGSIAGAGKSPHGLHPGCVICHIPLLFPSYLYRCVKASYERLWQQEETFYCDVKTHPSNRWHRYERACMLYRICYLNFHRLSCFLSAYDRLHFQCTCNLWYVISEFLMKRIKYEESYIQTDGKCNFHTRQPYVQHFLYWFLIKGNLMDRVTRHCVCCLANAVVDDVSIHVGVYCTVSVRNKQLTRYLSLYHHCYVLRWTVEDITIVLTVHEYLVLKRKELQPAWMITFIEAK